MTGMLRVGNCWLWREEKNRLGEQASIGSEAMSTGARGRRKQEADFFSVLLLQSSVFSPVVCQSLVLALFVTAFQLLLLRSHHLSGEKKEKMTRLTRRVCAAENPFKNVLTALPNPAGGVHGHFYSLAKLNDPRIGMCWIQCHDSFRTCW